MISRFNRFICHDNNVVIYNTLSKSIINIPDASKKEVIEYLNNYEGKELYDIGILAKSTEDEGNILSNLEKSVKESKNVLMVMLIMTYSCNSCCEYCFENKNLVMEDKIDINNTVNYILNKMNEGFSELEIHYFGGEPLIKYKDILEINNMLKLSGVKFRTNVITNGTLLTRKMVLSLLENNIRNYQITIDGTKELHNKRRPLKNGESSFDMIIQNLNSIIDLSVSINIRINVDSENVESLPEIYNSLPDSIKNSGMNSIYVSPVVGVMDKNFKNTMETRYKVIAKCYELIDEHKLNIDIPDPSYVPCPNMTNDSAFYIDLSGNKFTCGGFVGKYDKVESVYDRLTEYGNKRRDSLPTKTKCHTCELSPICLGGCSYEADAFGEFCQKEYLGKVLDLYVLNKIGENND